MLEDKNTKRTELDEIGEFGLIKRLASAIKIKNKETILGIGDDAAVLNYGKKMALISSDMLVEGVHFDLSYVPLKHLGYKAAMVNFSDIYAMNGIPKQIFVNIAISNRFSLEAIEEFYAGLRLACDKHGVDIAGGDTSTNRSGMVISITVCGVADKNQIVTRDKAKAGDLLCVSGDLGGAFLGLQLLEREKRIFMENPGIQPDLGENAYVLERQLKPEARLDIIKKLHEIGVVPSSMIDISDGLASEIFHLCTNSRVGCTVYENKIPIDQSAYQLALDLNLDPTVCAMNGGEDYELLFTISLKDHQKVSDNMDISFIGLITAETEGIRMIDKSDHVVPVRAQGWDAFTTEK
jgi:thiamine-monophosphate kinase